MCLQGSDLATTMLCPKFSQNGFCDDENCRNFHPNLICDLCGVICRTQEFFNAHIKGVKHAAMKRAATRSSTNGPRKCTICNIHLGPAGDVSVHVNGGKHQRACQQRGVAPNGPGVIVADEENNFDCPVCEIVIWGQTKAKHARTQRHLRKERFLAIRATLDEAEKDKNGVSVTPSDTSAYNLGLNSTGKATLDFSVGVDNPQLRMLLRSATFSNSGRQQS
jgi:helicase MOV-10